MPPFSLPATDHFSLLISIKYEILRTTVSNNNVFLAGDCDREEAVEVPEEGAMEVADVVPVVGQQGDTNVHHALRLMEKKG